MLKQIVSFGMALALASPSAAAELSQELTLSRAGRFFDASQVFPSVSSPVAEFMLFDPSMGELKRVMIDVTSEWRIVQSYSSQPFPSPPAAFSVTGTAFGSGIVYVGRSSSGSGGYELNPVYSGQNTVEGFGSFSLGQTFGIGLNGTSKASCGFNVEPFTLACGGANSELLTKGFFGLPGEKGYVGAFSNPRMSLSGTFPPGIAASEASFSETLKIKLTYIYAPVNAVPEPASWAMMIGGFGLVGAVARSRGRQARAGSQELA